MTASLDPSVYYPGTPSPSLRNSSFAYPNIQNLATFLHTIPTLLHRRVLLDLDPLHTHTARPRSIGRSRKAAVRRTRHRRISKALRYEPPDGELLPKLLIRLLADQSSPSDIVCGSTDMDRLAYFLASDVVGVFLVETGAAVVHTPHLFMLSHDGLPSRSDRVYRDWILNSGFAPWS